MKPSIAVKLPWIAIALASLPALAQNNSIFTGPSILGTGLGQVGQRSGEDVDLRFYANGTGIRDTGMIPYAVNEDGTLVDPGALYGYEVGLGAYGAHKTRRSRIGLDYSGNYRRYTNASFYNGTNQQLALEYTLQKSRRLIYNLSTSAGTQTFGTVLGYGADTFGGGNGLLFDNRTTFLNGNGSVSYAISNRTVVRASGNGYTVRRQARGLVGVNGYTLSGNIDHQLGRDSSIGFSYQHLHYDFPRAFGESDINIYSVNYSTKLTRSVEFAISGGIYRSEVQGVQNTTIDPVLQALLGVSSIPTAFYKANSLPNISAQIAKQFRRARALATYTRSINPGNGLFLTSRLENMGGVFSYSGTDRLTFTANVNSTHMQSLGQDLSPFRMVLGSARVNYLLGVGLNVGVEYARRHQDLQINSFQRDSSRVSISLSYSPGEIPISFH